MLCPIPRLSTVCLVLLFTSAGQLKRVTGSLSGPDGHARSDALNKFFDSIDKDGNGQIEAKEASQYIDANFEAGDVVGTPAKAAQQMRSKLDSSDADATVSKEEVESHLKALLKVSCGDFFINTLLWTQRLVVHPSQLWCFQLLLWLM